MAAAMFGALACAGCAGAPDPGATLTSNDEGYVVFGIGVVGYLPDSPTVSMVPDTIVDGKFAAKFTWPSFFGSPVDGYVIVKGHAGEALFISSVKPQFGAPQFVPCPTALAFRFQGGAVAYFDTIEFHARSGGGRAKFKPDPDGVRAFLRKHYPQLVDKLVPGKIEEIPFEDPPACGPLY